MHTTALVLFSGGQDSTTCLAHALARYERVETLGFDYGQRHHIEMQARTTVLAQLRAQFPHWAPRLGQDHVLTLDVLRQIGGSSLTDDVAFAMQADGLPNTFVPGRNLIFILHAAAWAYAKEIRHMVLGVCQSDYSGYPDCRPEFIEGFEQLANLATRAGVEGSRFRVHAPLMRMSKADIVREGIRLGVDFAQTVSCYQADAEGRACGHCDACRLRAQGFAEAGIADPTRYAGAGIG